jgi:fructose-bisphosphate aldolase, class II
MSFIPIITNTDLRMASTGAIRRFLAQNPKEFDPRKYLGAATIAMHDICKERYEAFDTAGKASKIKVMSLEKMYQRYKVDDFDPRVQ